MGYGDITPRSIPGKVLTMLWMVTGILLSSILTSTMTNVFNGADHIDIYKSPVAAKEGSLEAWVAKQTYSADVVPFPDYKSLFEALNDQRYLNPGIVNSIVHMHYMNNYTSLKTIKSLDDDIMISWYYQDGSIISKTLPKYGQKDLDASLHEYLRSIKMESLNINGNLIDFVTENAAIMYLCIFTGVFLLLVILYETLCALHKRYIKKSVLPKVNGSVTKVLPFEKCRDTIKVMANKDEIKVSKSKVDVIADDVLSLKTSLQELKAAINQMNQNNRIR